VGVGNPLRGDDGFGPHPWERLAGPCPGRLPGRRYRTRELCRQDREGKSRHDILLLDAVHLNVRLVNTLCWESRHPLKPGSPRTIYPPVCLSNISKTQTRLRSTCWGPAEKPLTGRRNVRPGQQSCGRNWHPKSGRHSIHNLDLLCVHRLNIAIEKNPYLAPAPNPRPHGLDRLAAETAVGGCIGPGV